MGVAAVVAAMNGLLNGPTAQSLWYPFSTKLTLVLELVPFRILGTSVPSSEPAHVSTILIKDASSTEAVVQCTTEVNSSSKVAVFVLLQIFIFIQKTSMDQLLMIDIVAFSFQPVEYDTPTDVVTGRTSGRGKTALFWFQLEPTFWVLNQFIFGQNALNSSRLGAGTRAESVPCWWKRGTGEVMITFSYWTIKRLQKTQKRLKITIKRQKTTTKSQNDFKETQIDPKGTKTTTKRQINIIISYHVYKVV